MFRFLPAFGWFVMLILAIGDLMAQAPKKTQLPPETNPAVPRQRTSGEAKAHAEKQFRDVIEPVLKRDCFGCHGEKKVTAGLNLQELKPDFTSETSGELWQRVYERVRDREMPPRKPDEAEPPFNEEKSTQHRQFVESLSDVARLRSVGSWDEIKPLVITGKDIPVIRLRKQIRNNAALQTSISRQLYIAGRVTLDMVLTSEANLGQAELELATTHEERIALLKKLLESARATEDVISTQYQSQVVDQNHVLRSKHARLQAQLRLQLELDKK